MCIGIIVLLGLGAFIVIASLGAALVNSWDLETEDANEFEASINEWARRQKEIEK